jgi:isopenicillin-N N-acyltransferase-like protein
MSVAYLEIEARGSDREIGRQIGEAARHLIVAGIAYYEEHHEAMGGPGFADAQEECLAFLPPARRALPGVVAQLEGMAEGADVPLGRLLVPNLGEELTCNSDPAGDRPPTQLPRLAHNEHCTTVGVRAGGRCLLGHNEDWWAGDVDKNVLLRITTDDGTRILAMTSACLLPPTGINSHGIATGGNTVYACDQRVGVPNNFIRRHLLESRSLADARERALLPTRARGSNHLFVDSSGALLDIETSATAAAVMESDDRQVHTNHFVDPAMAAYDLSTSQGTRLRRARAAALLDQGLARGDDLGELLRTILSDHDGLADAMSICAHPDLSVPLGERDMTTASMIWDPQALTVEVCAGPPCENERRLFSLT